MVRTGLLERLDFREDGAGLAGECGAGAQLDLPAVRVAADLLGLDLEFVRRKAGRLPHIPESRGAFEGAVRRTANEDWEPFALRRRWAKVALLIPIELPIERAVRP